MHADKVQVIKCENLIQGAARAGSEARLAAAIVNSPVCARVHVLCDGL